LNPGLIDRVFAEASADGRLALVGYLPAAWPSESGFRECAEAAFLAGLDILEVGVPTADPFLDGEVIRKAVASVMSTGVSAATALESSSPLAAGGVTPGGGQAPRAVIAMMYLPGYIELGRAALPERLAGLGYSGMLVVGAGDGDWREYAPAARAAGVAPIGFAGGETGHAELGILARRAGGFIYLPSYQGMTGREASFDEALGGRIAVVKQASRGLPVAVGFGVNSPDDVRALAGLGADGAIVGTAMVKAASDPDRLSKYVASLREATARRDA
jgi:tryptophan synthase alpha chain